MKKTTDLKISGFSLLVGPPGLELIFTFKLALILDTPYPSRAT
jgi:hypothetical protein